MWPPPCLRMVRRTARLHRNAPLRQTFMTSSQSASLMRSTGPSLRTPALLTRTSQSGQLAKIEANAFLTTHVEFLSAGRLHIVPGLDKEAGDLFCKIARPTRDDHQSLLRQTVALLLHVNPTSSDPSCRCFGRPFLCLRQGIF